MDPSEQKIHFKYPDSLVDLLGNLGISIAVTTYQSGKILLLGTNRGKLDIQTRNFERPMGMIAHGDQIWAGVGHTICRFVDFPSAAAKIEEGDYSACYLPMDIHFTGDMDIHEMAFGERLYFINTRFSCLCTTGDNASFVPVWKPPFITSLQPVDKCHLNGLCLQGRAPAFVTALGTTDTPLGWREKKADGGLLMDIRTNEVLLSGLSMPHSPRWHANDLWFLESGKGRLCRYANGRGEEIARVPGFTRGLHMVGDHAFIGVSKVRESATFSGLPVTRLARRVCGVWVVNIRTGEIVTFMDFTQGIDEIFSVTVLPHPLMEVADYSSPLSRVNYRIPQTDLGRAKMPETPLELATPVFEKGVDYYNENRKEEAVAAFEEALRIQPDHLPATFNMAVALGDLGRFDQAEAVLLKVVEKDAAIVETYNSLGYVYYKKGELEKARAEFEKALELDPDYQQARASLNILKQKLVQSPA